MESVNVTVRMNKTVSKKQSRKEIQEAFEALQKESVANGTDKMTMDEINAIIAEVRAETRYAK